MKVLLDTNVILDVLCNRKEFVVDSLKVFKFCELGTVEGYISSLSVANIVYIMRKNLDNSKIKKMLFSLSSIFQIVELRETDLFKAVDLNFSDYEDAVQTACALRINADCIVTRNLKDFSTSPVQGVSPSEFLGRVSL